MRWIYTPVEPPRPSREQGVSREFELTASAPISGTAVVAASTAPIIPPGMSPKRTTISQIYALQG